ncbi:hypothetical protein NDU88_004738 [Pleurodeles waltl]|uniref:Uncharacterized protein n=1 Tax=Pleurodeles waltl TaxID=8319 RepID=A0AAV7V5W5_PLEWA|nr:hypothetical protein NDU88_004738 [Pleurodeles waltl]
MHRLLTRLTDILFYSGTMTIPQAVYYPTKDHHEAGGKNPVERASPGCSSTEHGHQIADGLPARPILCRGTEVSKKRRRAARHERRRAAHPLLGNRGLACSRSGAGGPRVAAAAPGPNSRGNDPRGTWRGREAAEGPRPKEQSLTGGREADTALILQARLERDKPGPVGALENRIGLVAPWVSRGLHKRSPEEGLGPHRLHSERSPHNKVRENDRPN